jgi:hypothetical protein
LQTRDLQPGAVGVVDYIVNKNLVCIVYIFYIYTVARGLGVVSCVVAELHLLVLSSSVDCSRELHRARWVQGCVVVFIFIKIDCFSVLYAKTMEFLNPTGFTRGIMFFKLRAIDKQCQWGNRD